MQMCRFLITQMNPIGLQAIQRYFSNAKMKLKKMIIRVRKKRGKGRGGRRNPSRNTKGIQRYFSKKRRNHSSRRKMKRREEENRGKRKHPVELPGIRKCFWKTRMKIILRLEEEEIKREKEGSHQTARSARLFLENDNKNKRFVA